MRRHLQRLCHVQAAEQGSHRQLEAVGCLANLHGLPSDFDWPTIMQRQRMLPWLAELLPCQALADDVRLECVRLCQSLARASTAAAIVDSNLVCGRPMQWPQLPGDLIMLLRVAGRGHAECFDQTSAGSQWLTLPE